jgi:hypothetical protein
VRGFVVQFLEGPTDNPIRVISGWGLHHCTYWIEGVGWRILCRILDSNATQTIKAQHIRSLVELTKLYPDMVDATYRFASGGEGEKR